MASRTQELRRGADPACVFSIAFSKGERPHWLALSSDKGTVHVFSLDQRQPSSDVGTTAGTSDAGSLRNPVSPFSFVSVRPLYASLSFGTALSVASCDNESIYSQAACCIHLHISNQRLMRVEPT